MKLFFADSFDLTTFYPSFKGCLHPPILIYIAFKLLQRLVFTATQFCNFPAIKTIECYLLYLWLVSKHPKRWYTNLITFYITKFIPLTSHSSVPMIKPVMISLLYNIILYDEQNKMPIKCLLSHAHYNLNF